MKKTLAIVLAVALLCMVAVGTTLTYFTDTKGDVNTMTVGKVEITQNEDFPSSKLYPYTGTVTADSELDTAKNALTKTVTVTNNADSETAYIRTLFAFEAVNDADPVGDVIHVDYNTEVDANDNAYGTWAPVSAINITKNGVTTKYYVYSFTYANSYAAGATTEASLEKIALDGDEGNEFSGGSYEILVVSQAVQATGFETQGAAAALNAAFPINDAELTTWFNAVVNPTT